MRTFTAIDRCDRCGAQAYAVATKPKKAELLFCLHHVREHRRALLDSDWKVSLDTENVESLLGYVAPV